jgi:hypothetical protein
MVILLTSSVFDEIAIESELADERIDLAQAERQLRVVFEIAFLLFPRERATVWSIAECAANDPRP